ncbi:MAG: sigma-70 family RNA polymerase sigma factor [Parasporobacterium sp.]|nr:sigma-70 family RNA polymerase sigma factor [Parasporobacterium sp.]
MTNEQLCSLARDGDKAAEAALIENVLPSIRITAVNIQKRYSGILLEADDLVQEALIGVLRAINTYNQETGNLFLTYAQAIAENAILDYVRRCASAIPASGSILSLDAPPPGFDSEATITYADILPDDYNKNPEHLFIRKETITEVRNALGEISDRERAYLHYRYGFVDDMSHDQTETASHFHLSLSRARHTEKAALNNVRRALPGQ